MNRIHYIYIIALLLLLGAAMPLHAQIIKGNIYGGGEIAQVDGDTEVEINTGATIGSTIEKRNIYGGGLGASAETDVKTIAATDVYGTVHGGTKVTVNGGDIHGSVYGGGAGISGDATDEDADGNVLPHYMAAWVRRETKVHIKGGNIYGNIYAGGDLANSGWYTMEKMPEVITNKNGVAMPVVCSIHLEGGEVFGKVFGGGNGRFMMYDGYTNGAGKEYRTWHPELLGSICGSTYVKLDGTKVWGRIYGGGQAGNIYSVKASATLNRETTDYTDETLLATSGSTNVEILSGTAGHNIFGGGWGNIAVNGTITSANISGNTYVYFKDASIIEDKYLKDDGTKGVQDCSPAARNTESDVLHNLFGGGDVACVVGRSSYVKMIGAPSVSQDYKTSLFYTTALKDVGLPHFSALGGGYGKEAIIKGDTNVSVDLDSDTGLVYVIGGGLNGTVGGKTSVSVASNENSPIHSVYGGGYYAPVGKGTDVTVASGIITENVFGGGVMGNIGMTDDTSITMNISGGTISGNVYGANDVSGTVEGLVKLNITGGTIKKNLYGAGNGDHIGYYEPGLCLYDIGENDNYYYVNHSEDGAPVGNTYKGRPQTSAGVQMSLAGVTVMGQVFGGGNSCTVGHWKTDLSSKYGGDPHKWRDDPEFFEGGGKISITLGSNVTIGQTNDVVTPDYKNEDDDNVSGLYIGCSGKDLATQSKKITDNYYHHYYDASTAKYWPGFAVYKDGSDEPLTRADGVKPFNAYLNNILVWTDDVEFKIADGAENIWLANFVGGGFRGSMKTKSEAKKFTYTLPSSVTIGNCVIGGAYNTDVVYHIFETTDGHIYTEEDGHYKFLTNTEGLTQYDPVTNPNGDYDHIEYGADGETVKSIIRFNYDGGVLSSNGSVIEDFSTLNLQCNFVGGEKARVFGGCYASGIIQGDAVIYYEATDAYYVYGGGALANVMGSTKVNLFGGSLTNAYGGGLGRLADTDKDYAPVAALVYGDATVTLGKVSSTDPETGTKTYTASVVNGSIFGANNVNGTPLGHVLVHVLKTMSRGQANRNKTGNENNFDVKAVYGGGNQAAYVPTGSYNTSGCLTDKTKFAEVIIENCDNSIAYVYGGGNAAPVPATQVTIYGADAIDNAFAGGNGKGDGNRGADIGYLGFYSETGESTPTYGSGETHITIYGGTINYVFGGSNTLGYIRTHAYVDVPESLDGYNGPRCDLHLGDVHAGGNEAEMYCGGSVTLGCSDGADVVYAGANDANIHGDINLVIASGTYGKVFGGNNTSGNIEGSITVNIDETGCWPIIIGELYACGNQAPYSVYGYDTNGDCIKKLEDMADPSTKYEDPTINIISCTEIGTIFGAGLGETAMVYGNPTININTIKGKFAGYDGLTAEKTVIPPFLLDSDGKRIANEKKYIIPDDYGRIGTIYGGGNEGAVYGSTEVNIGTLTTNQHVSGSDALKAEIKDVGVTITGDVFGGGNEAIVSGNTIVTIGKEKTE